MSSVAESHLADVRATSRAAVQPRAIGVWLLCVAALVFLMVVVGGATRLTESGLSITHWSPVSGVIPPLTDAQWQAEFALYQQTTEYQVEHSWMGVSDFKTIYYWEWAHRLLGRIIGLAYALPYFWFMLRRRIPQGFHARLWGLLALGGLQGFIGWWMVSSGLVNRTDVSHYRLTVHLGVAFCIIAGLVWTALDLLCDRRVPANAGLQRAGKAMLCLLVLQVIWGGLVAGLNAGFAYNSWPLMNGYVLPPEALGMEPVWLNLTENTAMVQFIHRMLAYGLTGIGLWLVWQATGPQKARRLGGYATLVLAALGIQMLLGIATVLHAVPVWLGTAHQGGAVVLLASVLLFTHRAFGRGYVDGARAHGTG